ncbi:hypothetical protein C2W64_01622 [Brevibacillus laterosporus]|nr:ferritin-like domain-containing protein [Brevibacillus laterosporus]RAP30426.1 hypothetical protein C2W64_01622 [Brevibacillus laterosporus]
MKRVLSAGPKSQKAIQGEYEAIEFYKALATMAPYVSGLKKALDDEQEAADFYQKVYLGSKDPYIRKIFFEAMTDEMRHATRLSFLYSNYFLEDGMI